MSYTPTLFARILAATILLSAASGLAAEEAFVAGGGLVHMRHEIDWKNHELRARVIYDLKASGLQMPGARTRAEESTRMEFPALIEAAILELRVDSSSSIGDLIAGGALSASEVALFAASAQSLGSRIDLEAGTLTSRYTIGLDAALPLLVRHQATSRPPRALQAGSTRSYSGIIIFADEELPVHGTRRRAHARPCFFPKVHDDAMTLIYERHMVQPALARERGIVRYTQRSDADEWETLAGNDPMFILASGLFGVDATDPIIASEDALRILSNGANRALLEQGRVVIVVHPSVLSEGRE